MTPVSHCLSAFAPGDSIAVDANIFDYHFAAHPRFGPECTAFLSRVESGDVSALTTSLVVGEVVRFLQMKRGEDLLSTQSWPQIQAEFRANADFAKELWNTARQGLNYLQTLERGGLRIVGVGGEDYVRAATLGEGSKLLVADAVLAHACEVYGIAHIASNDADFDRVPFLTRWRPEATAPDS